MGATKLRSSNDMKFQFARVPFEDDGSVDKLFTGGKYFSGDLVEGVVLLDTIDEGFVDTGLQLVEYDFWCLNDMTDLMFHQLLVGNMSGRYILLRRRKHILNNLRNSLKGTREVGHNRFLKKFLACFLCNADACLEKYGSQASLIIL